MWVIQPMSALDVARTHSGLFVPPSSDDTSITVTAREFFPKEFSPRDFNYAEEHLKRSQNMAGKDVEPKVSDASSHAQRAGSLGTSSLLEEPPRQQVSRLSLYKLKEFKADKVQEPKRQSSSLKTSQASAAGLDVQSSARTIFLASVNKTLDDSANYVKRQVQGGLWHAPLELLVEFHSMTEQAIADIENSTKMAYNKEIMRLDSLKRRASADGDEKRNNLQAKIQSLKQENVKACIASEQLEYQVKELLQNYQREEFNCHQKEKDYERKHKASLRAMEEGHIKASDSLKEELTMERQMAICGLCRAVPKDTVILPCLHFLFCNKCLQQKGSCPSCKVKIIQTLLCNISMDT